MGAVGPRAVCFVGLGLVGAVAAPGDGIAAPASTGDGAAAASPVEVLLDGCPAMTSGEVERVLRLELASVAEIPGSRALLVARVACRSEEVEIRLHDPVTAKEVARRIPALTADEEGGERVVALAISQLFVASWMELLRPPEERPEPAAGVSPEVVSAARSEVDKVVESPEPPEPREPPGPVAPAPFPVSRPIGRPGPGADVGARVGVRFRGVGAGGDPVTTVGAVGHLWPIPRWGLALDLLWDRGVAVRGVGNVLTHAVWFGAGAAHRWRPAGHIVGVDVDAGFRVGYVRHIGVPRGDAIAANPQSGAGGEIQLSGGPTMRAGPVLVRLSATLGYTLRIPEAVVARRVQRIGDAQVLDLEDPVSPGGLFLGALLGVGWSSPAP